MDIPALRLVWLVQQDRDGWARLLAESTADRAGQALAISRLCVAHLDITGAGMSMVAEGSRGGVVCATDDVAAEIEALQFNLGEGPCMDAVRTGSAVLMPDLDHPEDMTTDRWPTFMGAARAAGARAVFAFPMRIGAINVGAMDFYRDVPGPLSDTDLQAAFDAADAGAHALLHIDIGEDGLVADDADTRSTYHVRVHQATGMVQVQLGIPTEEALLRLRARAFAVGRALADFAADVVERRVRFALEDE